MSTNDYLKFMTEQVVKYMDTPKAERKQMKKKKKTEKSPLLFRWFGILPYAIGMSVKKKNK
ncbi:YqzE family protein [Bacillus kexueae]|uniref:YqzE family protein n=1 Tax=Aeribacillus kexueae TaxID=2078952 RepID=UPI001FAF157F